MQKMRIQERGKKPIKEPSKFSLSVNFLEKKFNRELQQQI